MQGLPSLRIIFQSSDTSNIRKTILTFPESAASLLLQVLGIKFFVPKSCQSANSTVCFIQCCVVLSSVLYHRCLVGVSAKTNSDFPMHLDMSLGDFVCIFCAAYKVALALRRHLRFG